MTRDLCFDETVIADALRVRAVLTGLRQGALATLPDDFVDRIELVLAEAMNNITEHAYADVAGLIRVVIRRRADGLVIRLLDRGSAMPGLALPVGRLPETNADSLAEGGYGWFLIRSLSQRLMYRRCRTGNVLIVAMAPCNVLGG